MSDDDLTRDEVHDRIAWLKDRAREGADRLRATHAPVTQPKLTDAESAALARKRIDDQEKR
jgi:hypothetical protein